MEARAELKADVEVVVGIEVELDIHEEVKDCGTSLKSFISQFGPGWR